MRRPAVFFDRDNTLIANDGYLGDPSRVQLVDGAADAVARVRGLGYAAVVFSNQSGVARGMFAEEAVHAVNARLDELLHDQNPAAVVDRHEFCPFHPDATVERYRQDSALRKPKPGMILQAAEKLALDLSRSWVVGDAPRDVEAGRAAGCRTVLVTDAALAPSPAAADTETATGVADFVVGSLKEATEVIERNPPPAPVEQSAVADGPGAHQTRVEEKAAAARDDGADLIDAEVVVRPRIPAATVPVQAAAAPPDTDPKTPEFVAAASTEAEARHALEVDGAPTAEAVEPAVRGGAFETRTSLAPAARADEAAATRPSRGAPGSAARLEDVAREILQELRRRNEQGDADFSVPKLLAGIVQVIALAAVFFAYLRRDNADSLHASLLVAQFLQILTIALLIMGRQR